MMIHNKTNKHSNIMHNAKMFYPQQHNMKSYFLIYLKNVL
jgi:hypothetical protein